ncbi:hypothetical protein EIP91_000888 [Steccherinum ochraceum]|uniref:protein-serine/threonine phosphatase n=1 Tax=Steccherinum ochraceum TaxID=92696 RepID=A0A4R0RQ29_9APHY|nr:hypothetical protein EIP91_000888 [Steccherinum ochraceum]
MTVDKVDAPTPPQDLEREEYVHVVYTWSGKTFKLDIAESDRVFDLKTALQEQTNVPPERQKILGLVKGKLPDDEVKIGDLKLTSGKKFTLVGTPQGDEIKDPAQLLNLPDVVNDLDVDFSADPKAAAAFLNDQRNIRKVKEHTQKLQVNIIHPLRPGKKLLVLDIDYTILDTKPLTSGALPPRECARPGLHEFLEAVYPHYDICIWSQTSWVWLETKLIELEMLGGPHNYQISFVLDKTCMFTVFSTREGKQYKHSVKALQIIWNHFPQYGPANTIHVDDLGRNFALNPNQGLKIHAFKDAHTPQAMSDRELEKVSRYMVHIATNHADFANLNHKVFPGGNFDTKQDDSLITTAIRETFEETGLLVASSSSSAPPNDSEMDVAREAIHSQRLLFKDFLAKHGMSLNGKALLPFTQWVTPPTQPKRFHTQFYVTFLNASPASGFTSGQKQDRLPTPDGGQEVIAARFVHPRQVLSEFAAGKYFLFPPQFYILSTLAEFLDDVSNGPEQRAKIERLSEGMFGRMVINPRALKEKDEGRTVFVYEGDETRGGPVGRRHRSLVKFGKGGLPMGVEMQRNFDIFTEIASQASVENAKL